MDGEGDSRGDIRWLTYSQIAEMRGISRDSAERTVRRRGWRRQAGNDGLVRVAVPLAWLEAGESSPPDNHPDSPPDKSTDANGMAVAIEAIQQAHRAEIEAKDSLVGALREQLTRAEERADAATARADQADRAIAGERARADVLRGRLDAAQQAADQARAAAQDAQQTAEGLRQADAVRRAGGRLVRAWRAWRGEVRGLAR